MGEVGESSKGRRSAGEGEPFGSCGSVGDEDGEVEEEEERDEERILARMGIIVGVGFGVGTLVSAHLPQRP